MLTWSLDPVLFPLPPGAHPQRPWWYRVSWSSDRIGERRPEGLPDWRRRDGREVSEPSQIEVAVRSATGGATALSAEAQMARIDQESPLPRPPFRAGQVWVEGNGIQTLIIRVGMDGQPYGLCDGEMTPVTEIDTDVLSHHAFLVHDPIGVGDAPWAPPESP
jgi:hypothetical protein